MADGWRVPEVISESNQPLLHDQGMEGRKNHLVSSASRGEKM